MRSQFASLLKPLDLAGCVITMDAMHSQQDHAGFLVKAKDAHYIMS
jgi:predicted transposase YbfD/YdcC